MQRSGAQWWAVPTLHRVWFLLLTLLLAACAPRVPPAAPPAPSPPTDPAAIYAGLRAQADRIQTLRARFTAVVQDKSGERTAEGVLLVKKPTRFRLRLMSVLGPTVLDYGSVDGHTHLELPLQGKRYVDAELPGDQPFSPAEMRQAFLRADAAFPERCVPAAAGGDVLVTCRDAVGAVLRTVRVATATGLVSEEMSFAGDQPRVVTQFADYRRVEPMDLPFVIRISYPEQDLRVAIAIRRYELNPALADELFDAVSADGR